MELPYNSTFSLTHGLTRIYNVTYREKNSLTTGKWVSVKCESYISQKEGESRLAKLGLEAQVVENPRLLWGKQCRTDEGAKLLTGE